MRLNIFYIFKVAFLSSFFVFSFYAYSDGAPADPVEDRDLPPPPSNTAPTTSPSPDCTNRCDDGYVLDGTTCRRRVFNSCSNDGSVPLMRDFVVRGRRVGTATMESLDMPFELVRVELSGSRCVAVYQLLTGDVGIPSGYTLQGGNVLTETVDTSLSPLGSGGNCPSGTTRVGSVCGSNSNTQPARAECPTPTVFTCNHPEAYPEGNQCFVNCRDSSRALKKVLVSNIASQCYTVLCPDGTYKTQNTAGQCKKTCDDGSSVLVSATCPVMTATQTTIDSDNIHTNAPSMPAPRIGNRSINVHGENVFQSRYTIGRVDRPNYVCTSKDRVSATHPKQVYLGYYCPPLNECGDDYPSDTNLQACKCRKRSDGTKVIDTICEYARLEPFRMDFASRYGSSHSASATGEVRHKEIGPVSTEVSTVSIPTH